MKLEELIEKKQIDINKFIEKLDDFKKQMNEELELQIDKFYYKQAYEKFKKNDNKLGEMFKTLSPSELQKFKQQAKDFYEKAKKREWSEQYINRLDLIQTRKKITRIEYLLVYISNIIQSMLEFEKTNITTILTDAYMEGYLNTAYEINKKFNFGVELAKPNEQLILNVLLNKWSGKFDMYGLLDNQNIKVIETIKIELLKGIALGENSNKIANRVIDKTKILKSTAKTVIRTEMTRILNESSADSLKNINDELGGGLFEEYEILATLDSKTSEICQDMDGKTFKFKDKKVGINFPPLHPNCRSSYTVKFDDEETTERISKRLDNGTVEYVPSNLNYIDWQKTFIK